MESRTRPRSRSPNFPRAGSALSRLGFTVRERPAGREGDGRFVEIDRVVTGSPAFQAGLRPGMRILAVGDPPEPVNTSPNSRPRSGNLTRQPRRAAGGSQDRRMAARHLSAPVAGSPRKRNQPLTSFKNLKAGAEQPPHAATQCIRHGGQ